MPRSTARRAFTLIELMIVIVIIALLMALLTPAVMSAMRRARLAQAATEIQSLAQNIEDFKVKYGVQPPSFIDFTVNAAGTAFTNPRTLPTLRRLWPDMDLSNAITDLTAVGLKNKQLDGDRSLVFFLGGVPQLESGVVVDVTGFAANPRRPFATGGKRVGPFAKFDVGRFVFDSSTSPQTIAGYKDVLPGQEGTYYYVTNDRYNAVAVDSNPATQVYKKTATTFWNPQSYQLISPGFDYDRGAGGTYSVTSTPTLTGAANGDKDNLTNFVDGPLVP